MKRLIIIIVLLILGFEYSNAQQLPQFTQYMYNTIAINPAYAGSRGVLSIVGLNRNQWAGFDGGPQTQTLSIHSPLRNEKIGLGLSMMNDKTGYENLTYIYGDFSYTIQGNENFKISFGLKAGLTTYKLASELYNSAVNGSDQYFNDRLDRVNPNFGAGILFHSNKWYLGLSIPKLLTNDLNDTEYAALEVVHYYGIGGYVFELNKNLKLKPSFMMKYTKGAALSTDLTANLLFDEKIWFGGSYRINGAQRSFGALVDFQVSEQFRVGYTYEVPTGEIRPYTTGSHEILLMYEFKFTKGKMKSPRYF
ncbi:MAG: type IX secretion system membrane protein PorP/SprF [Lutibacter sp.]|uniref:PorP/SprF family type IX secretion system membrane protein n=1 Tax=Lutibacter sp. TaxID=1925666 RepID=UPI00183C8F31|nr:type IX secretion system membrane protein PorP/SprF [Lutibacter sp.]MBT8316452.1 type IX secretion system membrane protein PorP/SprF [Lutibacter sp.]NNJ57312.1 type IX secretion system membrane protein PorP/SprF [Lutibacter sp.]